MGEIEKILPRNFAENLLDLEIEIEKRCEIETIHELVVLYSVTEYYELIKDNKYIAYYKRLKNLLLRDRVQAVLIDYARPFSRRPFSSLNINNIKGNGSGNDVEDAGRLAESFQNSDPGRSENAGLETAERGRKERFYEGQGLNYFVLCNLRGQEKMIQDKLEARRVLRSNTVGNPEGDRRNAFENTEGDRRNAFDYTEGYRRNTFDHTEGDKSAGRCRY